MELFQAFFPVIRPAATLRQAPFDAGLNVF